MIHDDKFSSLYQKPINKWQKEQNRGLDKREEVQRLVMELTDCPAFTVFI